MPLALDLISVSGSMDAGNGGSTAIAFGVPLAGTYKVDLGETIMWGLGITNPTFGQASDFDVDTAGGPTRGNETVSPASARSLIPVVVVPSDIPGDFNRDGHVDASDISAMEVALADIHGYETAKGLTDAQLLKNGDINGDGQITNADLQALLTLLESGGGSNSSVPEPAAVVLLVLALPAISVCLRRRCRPGLSD